MIAIISEGIKEHFKNNWGKYALGAGTAALTPTAMTAKNLIQATNAINGSLNVAEAAKHYGDAARWNSLSPFRSKTFDVEAEKAPTLIKGLKLVDRINKEIDMKDDGPVMKAVSTWWMNRDH